MIKRCPNKFKHITRAKLRPKLNNWCRCSGKVQCYSKVLYSFGINDGNLMRILLKKVKVEDIYVDHIWVKCVELNNSRNYYWLSSSLLLLLNFIL